MSTAPVAADQIGLAPTREAAALIARFESVPFSRWHIRARIIVGSATFFDAFDALSMAYVLPVLAHLWALSQQQAGLLIGASYVGQVIGALVFSRLAQTCARRHGVADAPSAPPLVMASEPEHSRWRELLSPEFRRRSLIVWSLWACAFLITNSLNNWAPTLYHTVYGMGLRPALRAASLNNIAQVMVLLVCAILIDRIGRRTWTTWAFAAGGVSLAVLGLIGADNATPVVVLTTMSYGIIGSANAVLYLYTPEIYPTRMRAIGVGLATLWLRAASATGPMLVGLILADGSVRLLFLMFAGISALGVLASLQMIETRGRRLEEIAATPQPDATGGR